MLMWSHYAQEHQGVLVEYWFGGDLPSGVGIEQIKYQNELKRQIDENLYIFNQYILTKNKEWAYEDEVRLFSYKKDKVSFDSLDYLAPDRSKINARICSVTLGKAFPQDKVELVQNIVRSLNKKRAAYEPKIVIKEAYIPPNNKFAIKYRELDAD